MLAKLKSFAGQSFIYTLGGVLTRSLSFVLLPLYTWFLTPDDYGILGTVAPVYSILNILLAMGLQSCILRFYYEYQNEPEKLRTFLGTVNLFILGGGLVVTLALTFTGPQLFGAIFSQTAFYPYIFLTVWNAYLSNAKIVPLALFRARRQAKWYSLFTVGDFLVRTFLIIYFVTLQGEGAVGSLKGQALASLLTGLPVVLFAVRQSNLHFSFQHLKTAFAFSLPLLPHLLGNWLLNISDRIVLENWVSKSDLGLYTLAYNIGSVMNLLSTSLNEAWVPIFYQELSNQEESGQEDDSPIRLFVTYQVLFITGIGLALMLLSREVIQIMTAPGYWTAYRLVPWIVMGYLMRFFYFFPVNGVFYAKKTRWIPVVTIFSGVTNVGLNMWLIPRYGVDAAALNTFLGFLVLFLLVYFLGQHIFPIQYEMGRLLQIVLLALALFVVGRWFAPELLWQRLLFKTLVILSYPLLLWVTGFFSRQEQTKILQLYRRIQGRAV